MAENVAAFGCRVRGTRGRRVIELWGELDILAVEQMSERLLSLMGRGSTDLVLDLSQVSFIDCRGLSMLCAVRVRVQQGDGRLTLVSDKPQFRRLLRLTGLAEAFTVIGTREAFPGDPGDGDRRRPWRYRLIRLRAGDTRANSSPGRSPRRGDKDRGDDGAKPSTLRQEHV
ncbi:STAS domain-containing protein [Streptomyces sp. VRA16 Mangrove soil]|uniref:STAS domain-containing protein n=1 Tax=Streptomyces sp. VRA16 Mangrove soil TaxID=2817434 RepID=UPI001A9FA41D|nr:STAS domain-containing protein [Streptomyces sp. VRA16 Mangrove soil]MBO1330250.1 STAS domain-containing protein [Streptomyces sp. VRA16 Mangrove soil]